MVAFTGGVSRPGFFGPAFAWGEAALPLSFDEGEQIGVDLILMRGRVAVRRARIVDILCDLYQPRRLYRGVLDGDDLVILTDTLLSDNCRDSKIAAREKALPPRAISEINRRNNDIAVPSFILSGAPNFHHSRTMPATRNCGWPKLI